MIRIVRLAIVLSLLPISAEAACRSSDLAGTYDLRAETQSPFGTYWTTCDIRIARDGTIRPGTSCVQRDADGNEAQASVDGGAITLERSCRITGHITIAGYRSLVTEARMLRNKETVDGIGTNPHDGSAVTFTAQKTSTPDDTRPKRRRTRLFRRWF